MFKNRTHAADLLSQRLIEYKNTDSVVLAIPRGGVPIGAIISNTLNIPLDILLSKKIPHPFYKEYAIGAVTPYSHTINEDCTDVSETYINDQIRTITVNLKERAKKFRANKPSIPLKNKTVIVVDDGVATGQTLLAALNELRKQRPKKIIVAVPVASAEAALQMKKTADEFICLHVPVYMGSIGEFYQDFSQVNDEEVIHILQKTEFEIKS